MILRQLGLQNRCSFSRSTYYIGSVGVNDIIRTDINTQPLFFTYFLPSLSFSLFTCALLLPSTLPFTLYHHSSFLFCIHSLPSLFIFVFGNHLLTSTLLFSLLLNVTGMRLFSHPFSFAFTSFPISFTSCLYSILLLEFTWLHLC